VSPRRQGWDDTREWTHQRNGRGEPGEDAKKHGAWESERRARNPSQHADHHHVDGGGAEEATHALPHLPENVGGQLLMLQRQQVDDETLEPVGRDQPEESDDEDETRLTSTPTM